MTDLDIIISEIEKASTQEAEEIIAKAKAEADGIAGAARDSALRQAAESEAEAERRTAEIGLAGVSARQRTRRERILEAKQEMIGEVIREVRDKLYALPDIEYCELLAGLAVSAADICEGVILLNDRDKNRLPPDFEAKLADMLPAGATLSVSDETRPIDGGLILKYGSVEQNCSFDAIFAARCDEFSDLIHDSLFGG